MNASGLKNQARGFSLVEIMIGLTLGLLVLFGITSVIVSSSNSRNEIEKVGNQIENGRYAMQVLNDDIRLAGFFADFNPDQDPSTIKLPAALPDVCAVDDITLKAVVRLHLQGYDMGATIPPCIKDVKEKTDILIVRRLNTCAAGKAGCAAAVDGTSYLQVTQCNDEIKKASAVSDSTLLYNVSSKISDLTFKKRTCAADLADIRKYRTQIYFVANNNNDGDGMPTLKRAELDAGAFTIMPLVEGVENMQISYGIDTDATPGDGIPNIFVADPETANGCADKTCAVENWSDVMAVNVALLVRNTQESKGFKDTKTYTLGIDNGGNPQVFGPYGDSYKRHAYTSSIQLVNPSGRRE